MIALGYICMLDPEDWVGLGSSFQTIYNHQQYQKYEEKNKKGKVDANAKHNMNKINVREFLMGYGILKGLHLNDAGTQTNLHVHNKSTQVKTLL